MQLTIDYEKIFKEIPESILNEGKKSVRNYLTEYFVFKGIENKSNQDTIRHNIYKLLNKRIYDNFQINRK